jgi:hypothetical protein
MFLGSTGSGEEVEKIKASLKEVTKERDQLTASLKEMTKERDHLAANCQKYKEDLAHEAAFRFNIYIVLYRYSIADPGCLSRIRIFSIPDPHKKMYFKVF